MFENLVLLKELLMIWNQLPTFLIESPDILTFKLSWTFFGMQIDFIICSLMLVMYWFL